MNRNHNKSPLHANTLPNVSQTLTIWNGGTIDWKTFSGNKEYPISEFVRYIEFMGATGGSEDRDLFVNPADRTNKDDYDFTRLIALCKGALSCGFKPYLKLGNVPGKFTADYNPGSFKMNIRPPTDHLDHYRYMRACAAALKDEFGIDEVRTWRFSVLTECDNNSWFRAKSGDKEETKREFFKLYDWTVKAFEQELGNGLVIGTHLLNTIHGDAGWSNFTWRDVIAHCASGDNAATGGKGASLKLLTISYYIEKPGTLDHCPETLGKLADIRRELTANGFGDAITGVDEGRILSSTHGAASDALRMRIVGDSYEAAFDVHVAKAIFDGDADYFAAWGFFSGYASLGVPSHSFFTAREIAKFEGMTRIEVEQPGGLEVVAAVAQDNSTVRIMAGSLHDDLFWTERTETAVTIILPEPFRGMTAELSTLSLDDSNNWFTQWRTERVALGFQPNEYDWSWDDPAITSIRRQGNDGHFNLIQNKLLPKYSIMAGKIKPVKSEISVPSDGRITLKLQFNGNGAAFVELRRTTAS